MYLMIEINIFNIVKIFKYLYITLLKNVWNVLIILHIFLYKVL